MSLLPETAGWLEHVTAVWTAVTERWPSQLDLMELDRWRRLGLSVDEATEVIRAAHKRRAYDCRAGEAPLVRAWQCRPELKRRMQVKRLLT